jgi:Cd2+/Zn2+-exporting ATPase
MVEKEYILEGLNCANCARKIEELTNDIDGVDSAFLDFVSKKLKVKVEHEDKVEPVAQEIRGIVEKIEPDVKVIDEHEHLHEYEHNHVNGELDIYKIGKLVAGGIFFLIPLILKLNIKLEIALYAISYILVGGEVLLRAVKNVLNGQVFDENFLMSLATIGAFLVKEYPEGVAVMLFYQIGELFQDMAVDHSRKSIKSLLDIRPDYANLKKGNDIEKVDPSKVHVGDYIIVKPGEKVPLDGIIVQGSSMVDTSNITGESVPRTVNEGDSVLSGFINNSGLLTVSVTKEFGESTVSKILDLVENASSKKSPTENFITKFARYYTPTVVVSALLLAFVPPIVLGTGFSSWLYRALIFLVISCPCALVLSIPLGFFGGIGAASKSGILIKGGNYLEGLSQMGTAVFDKTGTLTKGVFKVTKINPEEGYTEEDILKLAALSEAYSNHPIGKSIVNAFGGKINREDIKEYKEFSGKGVKANIFESEILSGNKKLFNEQKVEIKKIDSYGTVVYIAKDRKFIGSIVISDELKDDSIDTIENLKNLGVNTVMLTGDNKKAGDKMGKILGVDKVYSELLPQDKVSILEDIIKRKGNAKKVVFLGDGVNDAPVLARADIGVAMGGLGSDAAIEASDVVIMTDEPKKLITGVNIARRTKKIVKENIIFALGVKVIVLILGAIGVATMWEAVFADVGVSLIAVLNSLRTLKVEE